MDTPPPSDGRSPDTSDNNTVPLLDSALEAGAEATEPRVDSDPAAESVEPESALDGYYHRCLEAADRGDWSAAFSGYMNVLAQETVRLQNDDIDWRTHLGEQDTHAFMVLYAIQRGSNKAPNPDISLPENTAIKDQLQLMATVTAMQAHNEMNRYAAQKNADRRGKPL